jgi:SP family arabinose:H+ symporter-like MFS transporter
MSSKLILWSITVSLGGFLFGMDVAVISGAEQDIQKLWNLSTLSHGLAVAIALYGTVLGAGFGGWPSDKLGRKLTLQWVAFLFVFSAIGSAIAPDVNTFMFFRFLGGLSIGASSVVAPIYISEIAPPKYRGRMVISFQLNIVLGILIAYVSNYFISGISDDWRWMLGIVAIPAVLFFVLLFFTPETPRWLILHRGDVDEARRIIAYTNPETEKEVNEIIQSKEDQTGSEKLFTKKFKLPLLLSFLFALFNQLSGINAVIYYSPRIFSMTGLGEESSLLSSAGIGLANLVFTILGWFFIDRFGRKVLMYIGSIGYIISLSLITLAFFNQSFANVPIYIFAFIASHAIGQGSVIWVFISEIFPNSVRASGMAWGSLTHWVLAAVIANAFPFFSEQFGGGIIFAFFAVMMIFQLLYVSMLMPETKGVSLENLQKQIIH